MAEWKRVKIGDFLTERSGRYKPGAKEILPYKRLDKIDFSGTIHLSEKDTKTDMILVCPGDLVISGINVAKGAITVYRGEEPITATIHYSSYTFNDEKIDLNFFKWFVKSEAFTDAIKRQVKGGIKTEIKAKTLLSLEISIPERISDQKKIVAEIESHVEKIDQISREIAKQKNYVKQLRQSVLQDAIEGKLTEDWRKKHPVIKGDINYDAEALYNHIQQEKQKLIAAGKIKKEKPLPELKVEDLDFEIPERWKWVKMGELCFPITKGTTPNTSEINQVGEIPYLKMYNIVDQKIDFDHRSQFISKDVHEKILARSKVYPNDVIMNIVGPPLGKIGIIPNEYPEWNLNQAMAIFRTYHNQMYRYVYLFLCSLVWVHKVQVLGVVGQDNVSLEECKNICIPLPPLEEQLFLTDFVNKRLLTIDELELQIATRETYAKTLLQTTLNGIFSE